MTGAPADAAVGALAAVDVSKDFPGVRALTSASVAIEPGTVTGLIGPNGAGKSTLIGVLTGRLQPDGGHLEIGGERTAFRSVRGAIDAGVQVIAQELIVAPGLSIAENLLLGRPPHTGFLTDQGALAREAQELADRIGLAGDVRRPVDELTPAQKRLVMIGRAAAADCRFMIMDEPTASLSPREVERLGEIMAGLCAQGVGVLYVSHRLSEVKRWCQTVTVLRDGGLVHTGPMADLGVADLVNLMSDVEEPGAAGAAAGAATDASASADVSASASAASADVSASAPAAPRPARVELAGAPPRPTGGELIVGRGLARGLLGGIDFTVRSGEIVGVAGLVGSGRTELLRLLGGADRPASGELRWSGELVTTHTVREALKHGIVLLPEDRRHEGGFQELSVEQNVTMAALGTFTAGGVVLRVRAARRAAAHGLARFSLPASRLGHPMRVLSGGNQQKALIAKWLLTRPAVFLFDEPTAGIDVHTKGEIRRALRELAAEGAGVVVVSSDNEEFPELCDRAVVLCEGRVAGWLEGRAITPRRILELSYGGHAAVPEQDAALG